MLIDPHHFNVAAEMLAAEMYKNDDEVLCYVNDIVSFYKNDDIDSAQEALAALDLRAKVIYTVAAAFQRATTSLNDSFSS